MVALRGRAVGLLVLILCFSGFCGASARADGLPAEFSLTGGSIPIPKSFLGVSIEDTQLINYETEGPLFRRILGLIRPQDGSPMILRIGGKSADHTIWLPALPKPKRQPKPNTNKPYPIKIKPITTVPSYLFGVGQDWVRRLAEMVHNDNLQVMLDLNLAAQNPMMETEFAKAVHLALGPRMIGMEVGNEPDLYFRQPQLVQESHFAHGNEPGQWNFAYSALDYRADYKKYALRLHAALPKVMLGGPEAISGSVPWIKSVEGLGGLTPGMLTVHRYPEASCFPPSSPFYPSINGLLSEGSSTGLARTVTAATNIAHANGQTIRLTEFNSVSCGGTLGVADSFATTLWSLDGMMEMVKAGVDGVNWHIRPGSVNAPFHPTDYGIAVQPELYGLALFAKMTGPGAVLLNSSLGEFTGLNVKVWAVRSQRGLQVLLLNKGPQASTVSLRLGAHGIGSLRRLLAPTIDSIAHVTYGGQMIGPHARWRGKPNVALLQPVDGVYQVTMPPYSGGLLALAH